MPVSAPPRPTESGDSTAGSQSGWTTVVLYSLGVALYLAVALTFMGLINFPPFMLACLLVTGWAGPRFWRRWHR